VLKSTSFPSFAISATAQQKYSYNNRRYETGLSMRASWILALATGLACFGCNLHGGDCCMAGLKAVVRGRKRMDPNVRDTILATKELAGKTPRKKLARAGIEMDTIDAKSLRDEIVYLKHMKRTLKKQQRREFKKAKRLEKQQQKEFKKMFDTQPGP
ncbi:hypothetical protein BOX15_Mlig017295g3, partial [Macrostomum lignano]